MASLITSRISIVGSIGLSSFDASRKLSAEPKLEWFRMVA